MTIPAFRLIALAAAPLMLSGCLAAIAPNESTSRVRTGQPARLGVIRVTPLQVVEDSRCPIGAQCVWPGRLRVRAYVEPTSGTHERTLTLGEPEQISGGTLLLANVIPAPRANEPIQPRDYSFIFTFTMPSRP